MRSSGQRTISHNPPTHYSFSTPETALTLVLAKQTVFPFADFLQFNRDLTYTLYRQNRPKTAKFSQLTSKNQNTEKKSLQANVFEMLAGTFFALSVLRQNARNEIHAEIKKQKPASLCFSGLSRILYLFRFRYLSRSSRILSGIVRETGHSAASAMKEVKAETKSPSSRSCSSESRAIVS